MNDGTQGKNTSLCEPYSHATLTLPYGTMEEEHGGSHHVSDAAIARICSAQDARPSMRGQRPTAPPWLDISRGST